MRNGQQTAVLHGHNKQAGRSGLVLSNFMPTKHAHEHFDLIIQLDIKQVRIRHDYLFP